ncbi:MAG: hypothetical protein R3C19_07415 [Planctomycetaceae bacterium]
MPATISKIRRAKARLLGTAAEEIPVAFQLRCDCGNLLEGTRRSSWQQAVCPQCQAVHFVLPVNVYPSTGSVSSEVIGGSFAHRLTTVVSELLPAKSPPASRPKKSADDAELSGAASAREREAQAVAADERPRFRLPRFTMPKIDFAGIAKRTFTPFRLLVLSMLGIVIATSAWMLHQRKLENARQSWRTSLDQVDGLLADADLTALQPVLADAVAAAETLGFHDSEFRRVVNLHQETEVYNSLAHADLLDSLFGAYSESGSLKSGAADSVRADMVGQVFVFDSGIVPDAGHAGLFVVEFPVTPGRHRVEIRIALPALAQLADVVEGNQYLFAAAVQNVSAPPENADGAWRIELQPDTFVLLTSEVHCRELGLPVDVDDVLRKRLEQQRDFVERSEQWVDRNQTILASDGMEER